MSTSFSGLLIIRLIFLYDFSLWLKQCFCEQILCGWLRRVFFFPCGEAVITQNIRIIFFSLSWSDQPRILVLCRYVAGRQSSQQTEETQSVQDLKFLMETQVVPSCPCWQQSTAVSLLKNVSAAQHTLCRTLTCFLLVLGTTKCGTFINVSCHW